MHGLLRSLSLWSSLQVLLLLLSVFASPCCGDKGIGDGVLRNLSTLAVLKTSSTVKQSKSNKVDQKKKYQLLDSEEIVSRLHWLADNYPKFATLESSQDSFGLPVAGTEQDCPFEKDGKGCKNWFLTISGSDEDNNLPEVFLSGCVHGNERVGPTAVMETATLLLESAACELNYSEACRASLLTESDISDKERLWMARLVQTRRIVIVPTANALGYYQNVREENGVDPNRDFPFEVEDPSKCMQTIAGRTINEIYKKHMFQLSLTFHAGMEVVAYEWGSPSYGKLLSPDHIAQAEIASSYSQYGGSWKQSSNYQVGTMNREVYPVRGGMEDWAYAASWDTDKVIRCQPTQYGGYPLESTMYTNSTHRTFNMLVEASQSKTPLKNQLGYSQHYLAGFDRKTNGHIARNVRLSLLAIELVQPYLQFQTANDVPITKLQQYKMIIPPSLSSVNIVWSVGGAFTVDSTRLIHSLKDNLDPNFKPTSTHTDKLQRTETLVGTTRWGNRIETIFNATVDTSTLTTGQELHIWAGASVDSNWKMTPASNYAPHELPQSHIVNARTNPDWRFENNGKVIQGKLEWFSDLPLILVVGEEDTTSVVEVVSHAKIPSKNTNSDIPRANGSKNTSSPHRFLYVFGITVLGIGALFVISQIRKLRLEEEEEFHIVSALDDEDEGDEEDFVSQFSGNQRVEEVELPVFS